MNPVFGARRRAEEFDSMLEATASHEGTSDARDADLLDLVVLMRQTPQPAPRPEFVADLRERIMLAAEGSLAPAVAAPAREPAVRRSPRERRIATAIGGFAIVGATASMAVAAQTALPGDTLYPLKRAIENVHAGVQGDAEGKGTTMLDNAAGRLAEVGELSRSGDQDARVIAETLQDFSEQAAQASDVLMGDFAATGTPGSIEELRSFTATSIEELQRLEQVIPAEARSSLIEAASVIRSIEDRAVSACPACSDLPLIEMPAFAAQAITPLLDDLLDTEVAASRESGQGSSTTPAAGQPTPADPSTSTPSGQPDVALPDPDPVVPSAPSTGTGGGGKGKGGKNPVQDLTTAVTGSEDPVGDLLSGTGEVVGGVVDGSVGDVVDGTVGGVVDGVGGAVGGLTGLG